MKIILLTILMVSGIWSFGQHTIEVKHKYYTLEYDTILKSPLISWYIQTKAHANSVVKIDRKTIALFKQDPLIDAKYQCANTKQYATYNVKHKSDGLRKDKGHLTPYSAMGFDLTAAKESMFYTNTTPQSSPFNEIVWEHLEMYVLKNVAKNYDNIEVYTGCLYGNEFMNDVPIPDYYWKAIKYNNTIEVFLGKNVATKETDYTTMTTTVGNLKKLIYSYYPKIKLNF